MRKASFSGSPDFWASTFRAISCVGVGWVEEEEGGWVGGLYIYVCYVCRVDVVGGCGGWMGGKYRGIAHADPFSVFVLAELGGVAQKSNREQVVEAWDRCVGRWMGGRI